MPHARIGDLISLRHDLGLELFLEELGQRDPYTTIDGVVLIAKELRFAQRLVLEQLARATRESLQ